MTAEPVILLEDVAVSYAERVAVRDVTMDITNHRVTALIGPSGCGKTTLLRSLNRMTDLTPQAYVSGTVSYRGRDVYGPDVDPTEIRRRIGMVFQKANVFPKSIYDNVAYGPRLHRVDGDLDALVEDSLTRAALWEEVKDVLHSEASQLSGGQQQRLVIARCLATGPDVILMDEPTASLDPVATGAIEQLIAELAVDYTIVLVTHDLAQARRISDATAYFSAEYDATGTRFGRLVEWAPTPRLFADPQDPRTAAYISGTSGA